MLFRSGKVPAGYGGKILDHTPDNAINAQVKFQMGAYTTRLVIFNPFTCEYRVIKEEASKEGVELGAKDLPKLNDKFKSKFTRTTYMLLDPGTLPTGPTEEQIENKVDELVDEALNDPAGWLKDFGYDLKEFVDVDEMAKTIYDSDGMEVMSSYDGSYDTQNVGGVEYYIFRLN